MLRLAVEGMEQGTIPPYPFTYLLVDEFQDTDPLQYRWIELHAKAGSIVTVVGDDDQSIYAFREALGYRGMESFITEFDAKPVVLGSNYRCRAEILSAADRVIRNNVDRIAKVLRAEKGAGGSVLPPVMRTNTRRRSRRSRCSGRCSRRAVVRDPRAYQSHPRSARRPSAARMA